MKAGPTSRSCPGFKGLVPRIQMLRKPFLSRTVVMVAVDTCDSVAIASADSDIWKACSDGRKDRRMLPGEGDAVKGCAKTAAISLIYRPHAD